MQEAMYSFLVSFIGTIYSQIGESPLHMAIEKENFGLAKLLVDRGSDVNVAGYHVIYCLYPVILFLYVRFRSTLHYIYALDGRRL